MPRLVQVRDCDGACCRESPRFPNHDRSDCLYHGTGGCMLRRDPSLIPDGDCPAYPRYTAADAVVVHCRGWPQNSTPKPGETGGCCFQWVE